MATKAYVLIETAVGKTRDVMNSLTNVAGMDAVDAVTGPYDIIAVVTANDLNSVGETVTEKIHTIAGVNRTVTCLVCECGVGQRLPPSTELRANGVLAPRRDGRFANRPYAGPGLAGLLDTGPVSGYGAGSAPV